MNIIFYTMKQVTPYKGKKAKAMIWFHCINIIKVSVCK